MIQALDALMPGFDPDITQIIYRQDTGELLGVHIIGIHASDLIQEVANAIAQRESVQNLSLLFPLTDRGF